MKAKAGTNELAGDLENDLAIAMLIEKRLSGRIGSLQALDLIAQVKHALADSSAPTDGEETAQNLIDGFPVH